MNGHTLRVAACLWASLFSLTARGADPPAFEERIKPFLATHCIGCHNEMTHKGGFRADTLTADFLARENRDRWQAALKKIDAGEMPPDSKKARPAEEDLKALRSWADAQDAEATLRRAAEGRVVLRRLNRTEYQNTIRDLLGISTDLKTQFPAETSAHGFDNVGDALHTSSFLLEKYLEAADLALNAAVANKPKPASISKRYSLKDSHVVKSTTESVYRKLDDTVVCFCSSAWHNVWLSNFYPAERGTYRFRISASGYQSGDKPVPYRVATTGNALSGKSGLVGYFDAPAGKPEVVEFTQFMDAKTTIAILPYGLAGANEVKAIGADKYTGPGLAVDFVEIEGPLNETWPPASHRLLFGDQPQGPAPAYNQRDRVEVISKDPAADADRLIRAFARRAFRRTVTDADVKPFIALVNTKLTEKHTFEQAMRAGYLGILISPEFLFLREKPGKLDDFALANRLSYFFWSSMPDEELLALAEKGKLGDAATLRGQVERMLNHPKAAAFTENFVGQWLGLRDIDATEPSHLLYPEYDHMLKVSMIRETELFFSEVLKNDLSIAELVSSDFTMLNGRLAKHYGIPAVEGWEFRKVKLPAGSHRGGLITMASVLKVTANGTTTSPVTRGAWVLDRILGTPPSPPPEGVAALDPDTRGATTIREQLAKHRSVASCAGCHTKIDPPGFALENFDVIGGWRDNYRITGNGTPITVDGKRMPYNRGKKVDPADVLPDGSRFENIDELKRLLLKDKDGITRALAVKLLTYSTGAPPAKSDDAEIDAIVKRVRAKEFGFRSLVYEIVQSEAFRTK